MPKRFIDIATRSAGPSRLDLRPVKKKTVPAPPPADQIFPEEKSRVKKPKLDFSKSAVPKEETPDFLKKASPAISAVKEETTPKDLWEEHEEKTSSNIFSETATPPEPLKDSKARTKAKHPKIVLITKTAVAVLVIGLMIGVSLFGRAFFSGASIFNQEGTNALEQLKHLVLSDDKKLQGEDNGRINVLLLGMGGEGHDGALLTDTVIVMSIKPATQQVAMLSLPRDLWVESENFGYSRINKINYSGEMKEPDKGPDYVVKTVEQITGLDIPYYLRIDFEGFSEIVDSLGGVTVDVENGFADSQYPGENYGYNPIAFERGVQTMNGEQALQYARSRHGVITERGPDSPVTNEASDFARSRRQQKLIAAIKDKALSTGVLANPQKLNSLFKALDKNILTNAQMWEGYRIFDLTKKFDINNVLVSVISNEEFLKVYITPDGAYTLIPVDGFGEYGKIRDFAQNIFDRAESLHGEEIALPQGTATPEEAETVATPEEPATIAVQNGTSITGLGAKTAEKLRADDFEVSNVSNAANQTQTQTIIYDQTGGQKRQQLEKLAADLDAEIKEEKAPLNKVGAADSADFVIIIGQQAAGYTQI